MAEGGKRPSGDEDLGLDSIRQFALTLEARIDELTSEFRSFVSDVRMELRQIKDTSPNAPATTPGNTATTPVHSEANVRPHDLRRPQRSEADFHPGNLKPFESHRLRHIEQLSDSESEFEGHLGEQLQRGDESHWKRQHEHLHYDNYKNQGHLEGSGGSSNKKFEREKPPCRKKKQNSILRRKSLAGAGSVWDSGVRRSTRIRVKPLQHWCGERLLYGRIHDSLATVIGVKKYETPPHNGRKTVMKVKSYVSKEYADLVAQAALY